MQPFLDEFATWSAADLWPGHPPYSFSQLEAFWEEAGGSSSSAPLAAAIGMAEQGANQLGDWVSGAPTSLGPWQINSANWPALEAAGIISSPADLMNPVKNAEAAIFVSGNGANWTPWTTFNTGAFRQYLQGGASGSWGPPGANSGSSASSAPASTSTSPAAPVNWSPAVGKAILAGAIVLAIVSVFIL